MFYKIIPKHKEQMFLGEIIKLYRDLPALWNVKSKIYRNREKKNMAYSILLAKYNEMFPDATKDDLRKKINSLRTNYRKELKKRLKSMVPGASKDSIYKPSIWYFEELNFLHDQESTLDSDNSKNLTADDYEDDEDKKPETPAFSHGHQDTLRSISPPRTSTNATQKAMTTETFIDSSDIRPRENKDEYYHWAMACAADLQKMETTQQLYAKKAIAEIIMEGQLGLLQRHSVKINENTS